MKIQIGINVQNPLNGYVLVDPASEKKLTKNTDISRLPCFQGQATEILIENALRIVPVESLEGIMASWSRYLRKGGELILCDLQTTKVGAKLTAGEITLEEFNYLMRNRNGFYTYRYIEKVAKKLGLAVLYINTHDDKFTIGLTK